MTTDQLGNLYLADCFAGRVQKFEPIPGADPAKIAGQILRTWDTWKPLSRRKFSSFGGMRNHTGPISWVVL